MPYSSSVYINAAGVHIVDDITKETVVRLSFVLGIATNNVAEYQAVLHALEWLFAHKELLADDIQINFRMDSKLVVSQLSGQWKIKDPKLRQLAGEIRERLRQLPGTYTFGHMKQDFLFTHEFIKDFFNGLDCSVNERRKSPVKRRNSLQSFLLPNFCCRIETTPRRFPAHRATMPVNLSH